MSSLIMSDNRPQQIADGIKTLTCRLAMPGDTFRRGDWSPLPDAVISAKGYVKWRVGGICPIVPKRGHPACLVDANGQVVRNYYDILYSRTLYDDIVYELSEKQARDVLLESNTGYALLKVRVTGLCGMDVRTMTDQEALDEGFASVSAYLNWWENTYGLDRYTAWQIRFERVLA